MSMFNTEHFAVIADIHSNADALTAVLDDISNQNVESIVNLGDHLSGPMAPRETAELLMAHDMLSICGNHDRWLLEIEREDMGSIDQVAFDQLDESHLNWLRQMPTTLALSDEIFCCHGTPSSDMTYWMEGVSAEGEIFVKPRNEIEKETVGIEASLFLCGHTHLQRRVDLPEGRVILNPGSVGCPGYIDDNPVHHVVQSGTGAACYALIEKTVHGWASTFKHVPYDPSRMIELAKSSGHPHWEERLATGWVG